jgi:hypothetical protein
MRTAVVIAVAGVLALSACAGGDDATTDEADGDTGAVVTEGQAEGQTEVDGSDEPTGGEDGEPAGDRPEARPTGLGGSCEVSVTGDKQIEWTAGGTVGDVASSYWFDDRDRSIMGDDFMLILNCTDFDGNAVSIVAGTAADETTVPFGPGTYEFTSAGAMMGDDPLGVLMVLADSETNWGIADEGGSVTIDRFDETTIAGTFSFTAEDTLAQISGDASEGTIQVTGSFDFRNPKG